jgi:hypothetical protein
MGSATDTKPAGAFLEPYIWNQFLSMYADQQMMMCNTIGWWGELWFNDNGEMMNRCYLGFAGDKVNYEMVLSDTESSI